MQETQSYRYPQKPKIMGPFRGILIEYNNNINFDEFKETYAELTFQHTNYYRSENYKNKSIVYYRYPYDAATMIVKHRNNPNFKISIYYDEISKTLRPDILYIETKDFSKVNVMIEALQGTIIYQQQSGIQVQFEDFKQAAIAYEEIRKHFLVKFTYKALVPKNDRQQNVIQVKESICEHEKSNIDQISELKQDISTILQKYSGWTPILKKEFQKAFEEIYEEEKQDELQPPSYVSSSRITDESSDDNEGSKESITPIEVIAKLSNMYKNIIQKKLK